MAYEAVQADAPARKPLPSEEAKVLHLSTLRPPDDLVLGDHQEGEEEEAAYLIVPDPCEIDIQQQLLRDPSPQAMKRLYYGYVLDKIDQGRSTLKDQYREVFAKKETTQRKRGKKIPAKSYPALPLPWPLLTKRSHEPVSLLSQAREYDELWSRGCTYLSGARGGG